MSAAEDLTAARDLFATKGWSKGSFARDSQGEKLAKPTTDAAFLCPSGAIMAACGYTIPSYGYSHAAQFVRLATGAYNLTFWNDEVAESQEQVIAAFDRAIELAGAA